MVIGAGSSMEKKVRARARRMELLVLIFTLGSHHKACMKTWTKYTRCHFIIFVQGLLKVLRHLNIGPGPCNFEILQYRLFLESVCVGKPSKGCFRTPPPRGHTIPLCSPIYTALRASFRLGF